MRTSTTEAHAQIHFHYRHEQPMGPYRIDNVPSGERGFRTRQHLGSASLSVRCGDFLAHKWQLANRFVVISCIDAHSKNHPEISASSFTDKNEPVEVSKPKSGFSHIANCTMPLRRSVWTLSFCPIKTRNVCGHGSH